MVARHDLSTDPALATALLTVRRGTAFWGRVLDALPDDALDGPSLLPGWSRRHVVAHVGYNARAITRLVSWAHTGVETPMYASPEQRAAEIDEGATQPARALRHLSEHAAITLDVEWRDTPDAVWAREVRTAQGRVVPLTETVWMRTREVWLHAVDLSAGLVPGATVSTIPADVLARLLSDVTAAWARTGAGADLRVEPTDGAAVPGWDGAPWGEGTTTVRGDLAELTAWATGRAHPFEAEAPRWI